MGSNIFMLDSDLKEFQNLIQQLLKAEQDEPVVPPIPPDSLKEHFDLSLSQKGLDEETFYQLLQQVVLKTPRTNSRLFFNQLFGGRRSKAVLGELMAVMLNNSMYTYKVAGPMVGVEKAIIGEICSMIGYGKEADGTLAPGGSMSNFMAMTMARDAIQPDAKTKGVVGKLILYTSISSHYSIAKNSALMGIGREQVRLVATDSYGVMDTNDLRNQIEADKAKGFTPFFVNATAGTTVLGAFDPIEEINAVCKEHGIWVHVDGAYCGGVIFSSKYKRLVKGLSETDSFSVNAHKMLGTPLSCSIVVTRHNKYLHDSFSNDAAYLYQTDGDNFNLGKTSLQCGRRNDALKFWTLWKSIGSEGLEEIVDHQFELGRVAREYISSNPDYTLYSFDDSISICFNYRGIPARQLCTALYEAASIMVGFGAFQDQEFVRMITINSDNEAADIIHFFKTLEDFVEKHPEEWVALETASH